MEDRKHIETCQYDFFNAIPKLDWESNLEAISKYTEEIIRSFAANKELFRYLLLKVPEDEYLWAKCEEDVNEDKIVLWDDVEKNLRIRLRMSKVPQERLAHSHRFSFTNLVLKGEYTHWIYKPTTNFNPKTNLDDVEEVIIQKDMAGDCFTIHHETLHSSPFTQTETISLVLRGNPVKRRAPVVFKESRGRQDAIDNAKQTKSSVLDYEPEVAIAGDGFWRIGQDDETPERRKERRMCIGTFYKWVNKLEQYGLI